MPYQKDGVRDYKRQNANVDSKPEAIKHRVENVRQNRALEKAGIGHKGDGLDAGHKIAFSRGGGSAPSNTVLQKASVNRSFARNADGSMKSEKSKRESK